MSALEIRGGGAVAVDTASLDAAAAGFELVAADLDDAGAGARAAAAEVIGVMFADQDGLDALADDIAALAAAARDLAARLRQASEVYAIVELRAALAAAQARGDGAMIVRARMALALARLDDPDAARAADAAVAAWRADTGAALGGQALALALHAGPFAVGALSVGLPVLRQVIRARGGGTIHAASAPPAPAPPADLLPLRRTARGGPPASLAEAASRVPGEGQARIRVEKYTMPDGSAQFAVYIAGTQTPTAGGTDPFDMQSNLELYGGGLSASYTAVVAALQAAGAGEGDAVHAFGHSQGGMIAARLAAEGAFDTRTVVTFGSPVVAAVGTQTLSVTVRHADDPVVALTDGGLPEAAGAPGSFVAERLADPRPDVGDLLAPSHHMTAYVDSAEQLDVSADPRMGAVRAVWADLGAAVAVETAVWGAVRPGDPVRRGGAAGAG
ncbi:MULTISPECIES: hypothetical protein [Microbacterium]|uniref:hypothetical protein n=1 Tax=Microbacterium TaxID=33882 RepID=UPI00214BFA01|nr:MULTISPECIES: hypothetical protein [unclassified Microbacterium]MCR2814003.1 hypothetical protein [Microbacterium sp. zg.Y1084]MDL5487194.1 hypothetical protein [Microbacterium sp. zg-Y1211]